MNNRLYNATAKAWKQARCNLALFRLKFTPNFEEVDKTMGENQLTLAERFGVAMAHLRASPMGDGSYRIECGAPRRLYVEFEGETLQLRLVTKGTSERATALRDLIVGVKDITFREAGKAVFIFETIEGFQNHVVVFSHAAYEIHKGMSLEQSDEDYYETLNRVSPQLAEFYARGGALSSYGEPLEHD